MTARLRTPALDGDTELDAMLRPTAADLLARHAAAAAQAAVEEAKRALGRLYPSTAQLDTIRAALTATATFRARVDALVAWAALAGDIDHVDPDDPDGTDSYWQQRDDLHRVVIGLTPHAEPWFREQYADRLAEAAANSADLIRDRDAGRTPRYLIHTGLPSVQDTTEADLTYWQQQIRGQAAVLARQSEVAR